MPRTAIEADRHVPAIGPLPKQVCSPHRLRADGRLLLASRSPNAEGSTCSYLSDFDWVLYSERALYLQIEWVCQLTVGAHRSRVATRSVNHPRRRLSRWSGGCPACGPMVHSTGGRTLAPGPRSGSARRRCRHRDRRPVGATVRVESDGRPRGVGRGDPRRVGERSLGPLAHPRGRRRGAR